MFILLGQNPQRLKILWNPTKVLLNLGMVLMNAANLHLCPPSISGAPK